MAANPIYIETEEEIPEVIERVRRTSAEDVRLVLPTRSRFGPVSYTHLTLPTILRV